MKIALDVYYYPDYALVAGLCFAHWDDQTPASLHQQKVDSVAEYEPGAFYKRELPCLLALLQNIDLSQIDTLIIDGYVILDDQGSIGLGGHIFQAFEGKIPVIGVAKTNFAKNTQNKKEIYRGSSQNPLIISALGMPLDTAAGCIKSMFGEFRIPHLLKLTDQYTRKPML